MKITVDILKSFKKGEVKAFDVIFWQYNKHVYNFIYSLIPEYTLAEDLTQNVFLKIWEKHDVINPEQNFESYLFTIARNSVYDETKKRLTSLQYYDSLEEEDLLVNSKIEEKLDEELLHKFLIKILKELLPARLEIFRLSRFEHLSYKEIAEKLSLSERTVETQIRRTLIFLRERLSSEDFMTFLFLLIIRNVK